MYGRHRKQLGGSVLGLILTLVVIGIGAYIGVQYVPQRIEISAVDSILEDIRQDFLTTPVSSVHDIQQSLDRHLNINEMNDMKKHFSIAQESGIFVIRVSYERELNLLVTTKQLQYQRKVALRS